VDLPSGAAAVERMDARSFFSEALRLSVDDPPEPDDRVALAQLRALLSPGGSEAALEEGARRGRDAVRRAAAPAEGGRVRGWRIGYDTGRYGTDYLRRAAVALAGVEPAPDELSAMVDIDADGRPLSGRDRYVLRFPAEATPPVNGFWTLITAAASTGDRRGLALDGDGSLPIHIQHAAPDAPRRCNWLPAPAERFNVELRLYWPCEPALDGHWTPPALTRVGPLRRPGRRPRRDRSARP